jgi:hypothetical protein
MRSEIIIAGVRFQNSAQMRLAQDNDVVHTFTPDRSDQPFDAGVMGLSRMPMARNRRVTTLPQSGRDRGSGSAALHSTGMLL